MNAIKDRITYNASDFAGVNRRKILDEAHTPDGAQVRDTDGTALVVLPQAEVDFLHALNDYLVMYLSLERALQVAREQRDVLVFGSCGWAESLDDEDLASLCEEFAQELARASASKDIEGLRYELSGWMETARAMRNPVSRAILLGEVSEDDFIEVDRPTESDAK